MSIADSLALKSACRGLITFVDAFTVGAREPAREPEEDRGKHDNRDWEHSMEITVYQPRILVEYCDFMTSISTVSQGFLSCCIFKISQPVS
jgi:hypothetical protein